MNFVIYILYIDLYLTLDRLITLKFLTGTLFSVFLLCIAKEMNINRLPIDSFLLNYVTCNFEIFNRFSIGNSTYIYYAIRYNFERSKILEYSIFISEFSLFLRFSFTHDDNTNDEKHNN